MFNIYVGNLPYDTTETDLNDLFGAHGEIDRVHIVMDRETGRSRGFGFVEMDDGDANNAINALNGTDFDGRNLVVNEARERQAGGGGGGGRGGFGGGRGGGGGGGGGWGGGGGGGGGRRGGGGGGW